MPSLLDDPEAYAFAAQIAEDRRRKLTNQQALNAILQGVGDLPYTLLGAPVEISTGLLRAGGMAQGEQAGGIDYFKRKATELGIRPPDSDNPTMRDMRMGAEIAMGGVDPTRVARAGGAVAGAVAREAKPIIGDALENYMARSGLAPRVVPEEGLLGGKAFDVSKTDASDIFGAGAEKVIYKDPNSGGYIQVLTRPDQPASVTALEVPEAFRKQGIGGSLQEQALKDFPNMQGQVSSKSAARSAYKQGRRPVGQPDATLDDVLKMIDDDSSVNLVSPTRQQEMSGAQGGLLGQTSKSLSDIENKFKDVSLDLHEKNNTINLSRIVVPKDMRNSGVGTDVMQDLVSYADQTGQKVALTPSSDFGGNVKKLKEFYKRFGFVENKGRNKDFTTRETMIRPAKEQEIGGSQSGLLDTDYRGSHSAPNAEVYGATLDDLTKIMPANVYAPEGKQLYGLGDRLVDSEWRIAALKAKGKPDAEIEVYRAVPKGVKDINSGDWVTTSKTYADQHGERTLDGDYEIIKRKVKARTLSSEGYPYEFGYNE